MKYVRTLASLIVKALLTPYKSIDLWEIFVHVTTGTECVHGSNAIKSFMQILTLHVWLYWWLSFPSAKLINSCMHKKELVKKVVHCDSALQALVVQKMDSAVHQAPVVQ